MDTETVTVSGNGTYTTPTGFTLPTTGTVTGTYQWDATYSGDTNNNTVSDNDVGSGAGDGQPRPARRCGTIPNPTTVTLGANAVTLTDTAHAGGRLQPDRHDHLHAVPQRGTTPVDTETVTVSGNGTYTTPTGFTLPTSGTVTGTYQWDASYSGDTNNSTVSDNDAGSGAGDGQRRPARR